MLVVKYCTANCHKYSYFCNETDPWKVAFSVNALHVLILWAINIITIEM